MDAPTTASRLVARYALTPTDLVVEVGGGDESVLPAVRERGPRILAVEPDAKSARAALSVGIDVLCKSFDADCADLIRRRYGLVRLLISRTVSCPELLAAAVRCLNCDGVVVQIGDVALIEMRPLFPPAKRAA